MNAQDNKAVHIAGGNYFVDLRIDISESHRRFSSLDRSMVSIRRSQYRNLLKLKLTEKALQGGLYEFLVVNGILRKWFDDFQSYWSNILHGRPITPFDFFMLLYDYRKRQQYTTQLTWNAPTQHLANWQNPAQIFLTMSNVRKFALNPTEGVNLLKIISPGSRVLEYGYALAPYYYSYREFFSHLECNWILADIPSFPFHYATYLYRNDAGVDFVTIDEQTYSNPLGENSNFDVIILTTVFEHLDNPLFSAEYFMERLKPGGIFVFDYIKSEGTGLDHPNAVRVREDCLRYILERTTIIDGRIDDVNETIGLCIAKNI